MVRCGVTLIGLFLPWVAFAQAPTSLHAAYATYAAGLEVANADATINFGPRTYQMSFAYRTTGLVGWFSRGQQFDTVHGTWQGTKAVPSRYVGQGTWRGTSRVADIAYANGQPEIRQLEPPDQADREPVPGSLRANSIDSLSAVVELMRVAGKTGRCDTTVRTYDGRRVFEIAAHTIGKEILQPTSRSSFAGTALHCGFSGRMVAGFKRDSDRSRDGRPVNGSAWLASVVPEGPAVPVRMNFETRWMGNVTMELTGVRPGEAVKVVGGNP
jgi:Protein of unknown function (DUF3108)